MKKLIFFATIGILLSSCSNSGNNTQAKKNEIVITNDLENAKGMIPGWLNENTVIAMKTPQAHSGEYASVICSTFPYGYYYKEGIKNINNEIPKSATFSGWVYTTVANPNFSIICDLKQDTIGYDWKAFSLDKELSQPGKWVEFSADFAFDKPLKPEHTIALYAWNQSKDSVYIDDLKVTFTY